MLISHRRSAYMDADEVERAAGMCEINAKGAADATEAHLWQGAAFALRILHTQDISDAKAMALVLDRAINKYVQDSFGQEN